MFAILPSEKVSTLQSRAAASPTRAWLSSVMSDLYAGAGMICPVNEKTSLDRQKLLPVRTVNGYLP